jgi:molecular chaperone HtpG
MSSETFAFSADINQLLSLIINAIYSNKDIFLRELISNASDALNKLRYASLTDTQIVDKYPNLEIRLSLDKTNNRIIIQDSGIGMTREELINNLGTIANSGTKSFLETLKAGSDISLIGQFGVGFYSAYLVADKVSVISKHYNEENIYIWESLAGGSFTVTQDETNDYGLQRGTIIILNLKEEMREKYISESEIKNLIKKHNQFIDFPIYLQVEKTREIPKTQGTETQGTETQETETQETETQETETQETETQETETQETETQETETQETETQETETQENDVELEDVSDEEDETENRIETENKTETKVNTKTEKYNEWDLLNTQKPIWTRNPQQVSEQEYQDFYSSLVSHGEALQHLHFSVEGQLEFKGLLYTPKTAPHDLFDNKKKTSEIKLYVRRIFITDECDEIIPDYLKFIKGVIDSEDLPLNISREMLQENKIMKVIRKNIIKKCLEMFENIAQDEEKYKIFYEQYSKNIKLGIHEDNTNKTKLSNLLRFQTSKSENNLISFAQYISNMKENQKGIYYITGESKIAVQNSPFLEKLRKRDIEVLYLVDPIDEYMIQQIQEHDSKKLICITKEKCEFEEEGEEEKNNFKNLEKEYENTCKHIKTILKDQVEKVILTNKLENTPCVLTTSEYGWTANMQRIMKAQALKNNEMTQFMMGRKSLEINPNNEIIKKIKTKVERNDDLKTVSDLVWLLYDVTLQNSGFTLEDPSDFTNRILRLINYGLGDIDEKQNDLIENEEEKMDINMDNVNEINNDEERNIINDSMELVD